VWRSQHEEIAMRSLFVFLSAFVASGVSAQTHYVDVYNTAPASVSAFESAPAGSAAYQRANLGSAPLRGGGDSVTLKFDGADAGCLRDLRITFADGRVLEHAGFNVCRYRSYHIGRYWRVAPAGASVAARP
jgi:hypothetical protein